MVGQADVGIRCGLHGSHLQRFFLILSYPKRLHRPSYYANHTEHLNHERRYNHCCCWWHVGFSLYGTIHARLCRASKTIRWVLGLLHMPAFGNLLSYCYHWKQEYSHGWKSCMRGCSYCLGGNLLQRCLDRGGLLMSCSLLLTVISWVTDAAAMHDIAHPHLRGVSDVWHPNGFVYLAKVPGMRVPLVSDHEVIVKRSLSDAVLEPTRAELSEEPAIFYEIYSDDYLDLTVRDNVPFWLDGTSSWQTIILQLSRASEESDITLTISGLKPDSLYNLYDNGIQDHAIEPSRCQWHRVLHPGSLCNPFASYRYPTKHHPCWGCSRRCLSQWPAYRYLGRHFVYSACGHQRHSSHRS